jgi:ABC-2 type transport system permease protein
VRLPPLDPQLRARGVGGGLTATLIGLVPSAAVSTARALFGALLVITLSAESFDWPAWISDLSPLAQTPTMPAERWSATPVLALLVLATALLAAGAAVSRRRDLTTG